MGERIEGWFRLLMLWLVVAFLVRAGTDALSAGDRFSGVVLLIAAVVFFKEHKALEARFKLLLRWLNEQAKATRGR